MYKLFKEKTMNYKWNKWMVFLRMDKDWTKKEAAERCLTDRKLYGSWEGGIRIPSKISQKNIAKAFGVRVEDLFASIHMKSITLLIMCISLI
ncbi:MAG: putative transcriptional regulator [Sedimentibacter sp.]|jgi:transcriptional regulator with XRE-family HTH domain|nr:putative transcriptional regulator [Sedimentibacter sp.]